MQCSVLPANVNRDQLRSAIQEKHTAVAETPEIGFHFHTGRALAAMLGYAMDEVEQLPGATAESFAGTGNPFTMGRLRPGETVLDIVSLGHQASRSAGVSERARLSACRATRQRTVSAPFVLYRVN